jgi:hypothetical protein
MERKGSAKKWGGLFKLFGNSETDTKEEDIETDEALNSVEEDIMNKEVEVQKINIETNPEHSAAASENVTPNQQFAEVTKEYRLTLLKNFSHVLLQLPKCFVPVQMF